MKRSNYLLLFNAIIISLVVLTGCLKEELNTLSVNTQAIEIPKDGGNTNILIQTDANAWNITHTGTNWLALSINSGTGEKATVNMSIATKSLTARFDTLTITAGNAKPKQIIVSQPSSEYLYALTANLSSINYAIGGSSEAVTINTDAAQWAIASDAAWIQFSQSTGTKGSSSINITAANNANGDARTATITISAEFAPSVQITVSQKGGLYPNYNTSPIAPDATGMGSTAVEIAAKIKAGMNIGNTLEAIGGETAWGNPKITKAYVDLLKQSGFNAVRLPCSWNQYLANSDKAQIKTEWLNRVKEVVQYCIDDDMYVLLNIHWDGGWLENNCTEAKQVENNAKQKAFWEQIATQMRDFDEHLLFASANEPNVSTATQMAVLNSYHQTFINAVRATGGRNSYRVLVVQGPSTDIETTNKLMNTLPTDPIANRMMVEIHYYTPWNFCGMTKDETWGNQFYYWGAPNHSTTDTKHNPTWGEESTVDEYLAKMKTKFVDKGIPVIMGEYGCMLRTNLTGDALALHKASRAYYLKYVTKQAKANGILPFYWDAGGDGAIFKRSNNSVLDQPGLDALIQGASN
jgi:endoglucanase